MAEEVKNPEPRKTVSFSHRQLGVGGISLIAALYMIEPLRDFVRNETKPQAEQIVEIKASQSAFKAEIKAEMLLTKAEVITEIKENANRVILEVKAVESRAEKTNERQDREMEASSREVAELRSLIFKNSTKRNN